jgi:hypothetical protein
MPSLLQRGADHETSRRALICVTAVTRRLDASIERRRDVPVVLGGLAPERQFMLDGLAPERQVVLDGLAPERQVVLGGLAPGRRSGESPFEPATCGCEGPSSVICGLE